MKKIVPLILTVMAACSAPKDISVRLVGVHPLNNECVVEDFDTFRTSGTMNTFYTGSYLAAFGTASDLQIINTEIGEDTLQGGSRNVFYVDTKVLRYVGYPDGVEIGREEVPVLGTINPESDGSDSYFGMNLIGPATFGEVISRAATAPFSMNVEVSLKGKLYSGPEVQTNTVSYPLTVFRAETTCTAPLVLDTDVATNNSACGNVGQDGAVPQCVEP